GEHYEPLPLPAPEAATISPPAPAPAIPRLTAQTKPQAANPLTARIALDRLERMDNYVGELVINRNGLSLQNEQFQRTVRHLKQRFKTFRTLAKQLQTLSDKILTNPERINLAAAPWQNSSPIANASSPLLLETQFDALELDTYSAVNLMLEELLEELLQVEESIEDVHLFAGQSNQKLEKQRQLITRLRDELMWSRMVPLSGVLNRFPRILRDLSSSHQKPVQLELKGTEVLVDRVMLEKLYDPLMHLLRNAFDHGIESPEDRRQQGKPEQGTIEIRAYHQGNNTMIEVHDDGHGLDLTRIGQRAVEAGLISPGELSTIHKQQLYKTIFEPGFSTAAQVSDLSGRGVGLDVVLDRLQSFNGKVSVVSEPGQGTTFTLRIPLTLTLAKLIVVKVGTTLMALSSDGVEEIVTPLDNQMKESAGQRFLLWRNQLVPVHALEALQPYACAIPDAPHDMALASRYRAKKPLLIMQREHEVLALEVGQIITEQELVIKPFSKSIAAPRYMNGCTVLGDGRLVPVIDAIGVVDYRPKDRGQMAPSSAATHASPPALGAGRSSAQTLLIIDDSAALRRTLALTLQKAGYRVIQAKDGREALDQLQQGRDIQLIICDIEMPRMNGFEFLSQKRLTPAFASIPTVMLTSRSSPKHRMLALQLGADSYFSKPYIEADFLTALKTHLKTALTPA
ncbi:MAG: response regulator, partial [Cyanobacteria bacterium]|nr:response regulator [Cyanobacteriota bacterium]